MREAEAVPRHWQDLVCLRGSRGRSLVRRQSLSHEQAIALMVRLVSAAAGSEV